MMLSEKADGKMAKWRRENLTTAEAAAIIGVSRHEAQRLCRLGLLPAQRLGRDWLVREQDAREYQRGQRGMRRQTVLPLPAAEVA